VEQDPKRSIEGGAYGAEFIWVACSLALALVGTKRLVYIRFVVSDRHDSSDQRRGVFSALYALERRGELAPYELEWFRAAEAWFNEHLRRPDRLAWSSRPNAPERAITWLKASATEHVSRMRELVALLEHKAIAVEELRTDRPGYVVYEDDHQVAAMPFKTETF
jgi:hypothetical protein